MKKSSGFSFAFFAVLFLLLGLQSAELWAQLIERPNNPALKPFNFGLSAEADDVTVSPDDTVVVVNDTSNLVLIETTNFSLAQTQPDSLESRAESFQFLPNSLSLFAAQNDGFITRILADDPLNDVLNVDVSETTGTGNFGLVMDPEAIDEHLYLLNYSSNTLFEYKISTRTIPTTTLVNPPQGFNNLNDLVYIALPADIVGNTGGEIDKMAIPTSDGQVLFYDESLNFIGSLLLTGTNEELCPTNGNAEDNVLPAAAVGPDRDLLFVLNVTDNVVHVVNTITLSEIDTDPDVNDGNPTPICLREVVPGDDTPQDINENIRDVVSMRLNLPLNAPRAFVTGDLGVTVLNADPNDLGVIDQSEDSNETGNILMSRTPNLITASSTEDGYLYVTNTDNSISIISEKPFVTINSITPDLVTQGDGNFSINFQVDELCEGCQYRVRANGDIDESGTLLGEFTYSATDAANTDLNTPSIDANSFPAGTFIEGQNSIFIFSDDADGLTGRDSVFLTVDQPPPDVVILSTAFGNAKGFINIERLTQEDIAQYNVYVLAALDQANPTCPGGLDFSALTEPTAIVSQPSGGSEVRITIDGLINGTVYCVGVQAQDNTGNLSANITVATDPIIPEVTVGILGRAGETGCALNPQLESKGAWAYILLVLIPLGVTVLRQAWGRRLFRTLSLGILLGILLVSPLRKAQAIEVTEQDWALQFQGGFFLPTNSNVKDFLGLCCNGMYQLTFGRLWKSQYEVNLGVGFMVENATAVGINTGRESGERFNFFVLPISNSFIYRADFVENQLLVPFVNVGFDYMFFRENLQGSVIDGWKFGYHAGIGLQILMEFFDTVADGMENYGINDVYFTMEGRWSQIDDFGGPGLALNGVTAFAGILFEF